MTLLNRCNIILPLFTLLFSYAAISHANSPATSEAAAINPSVPIQHYLTKATTSRTLSSTQVPAPLFSFFEFNPVSVTSNISTQHTSSGGTATGGGGDNYANPYIINHSGNPLYLYISTTSPLITVTSCTIPDGAAGYYESFLSCPKTTGSSLYLFIATASFTNQASYINDKFPPCAPKIFEYNTNFSYPIQKTFTLTVSSSSHFSITA